jgi:hypothetical protein
MLLWIVVGLIGFFYQFELQDRVLAFMFTISMGIILITVAILKTE